MRGNTGLINCVCGMRIVFPNLDMYHVNPGMYQKNLLCTSLWAWLGEDEKKVLKFDGEYTELTSPMGSHQLSVELVMNISVRTARDAGK